MPAAWLHHSRSDTDSDFNSNFYLFVDKHFWDHWSSDVLCFCFYSTDAVAFFYSHFGASSGTRTVHLDEVECTGSETNLTDCPRSSAINCSSVQSYAGVRCQGLEI